MQIGAFSFDSHDALLIENLNAPLRIPKVEKMSQLTYWTLNCWFEGLQLVQCPLCDLD
ncbi:hypothetical protein OROMI_019600 [Orobanche minor]